MCASIVGLSYHLPKRVVTNYDLQVENPTWDMQRVAQKTGIESRRIAGDDQTAAAFDGGAKAGLFRQCLRPRIDQEREFTGILDPGRPQAPAHQMKMSGPILDDNNRNGLRRRNIILWRKIWLLVIAK